MMPKRTDILGVLGRWARLTQQDIEERALKFVGQHDWYKLLLLQINRQWSNLISIPEDAPKYLEERYFFIDSDLSPVPPEAINHRSIIALSGSHGFGYDVEPSESLRYVQRGLGIWQEFVDEAMPDASDGVTTGFFERITRADLRRVKYEFNFVPDYWHTHVAGLFHDVFMPRMRKPDGEGGFERFTKDELEKNFRLTFATYSYGGLFLREAMNFTALWMADFGYTPDEIQAAFQQLVSIEVGPNYNPTADPAVIPQYQRVILASPNDRRLIDAAAYMDERKRYYRGEKYIKLHPEGSTWLLWVDGMRKKFAYDEQGERIETYWGHKLKDYLAAMEDPQNAGIALEVLKHSTTCELVDSIDAFFTVREQGKIACRG